MVWANLKLTQKPTIKLKTFLITESQLGEYNTSS